EVAAALVRHDRRARAGQAVELLERDAFERRRIGRAPLALAGILLGVVHRVGERLERRFGARVGDGRVEKYGYDGIEIVVTEFQLAEQRGLDVRRRGDVKHRTVRRRLRDVGDRLRAAAAGAVLDDKID